MLGIAIINYNQWQKTIDCINSIFATISTIEYKIYLLDNESSNNSCDELFKVFGDNEKVDFIKSSTNLGYANGNNLCINRAKNDGCDKILISNNDIVFSPFTIDKMIDDITKNHCLMVAPFIKNPNGSTQISVKINRPSYKEYLFTSTYLHNFLSDEKKAKLRQQPTKMTKVYWASGACFMADMVQFEQIGYFDKNTFLYFEEYIISQKAKQNNFEIIFDPKTEVMHYHGASSGGNANLFIRIENFKSECYMFKNYWKISNSKLEFIRFIRCLEVLFTFSKEKKTNQAFEFIKQSKRILKNTKVIINET